MPEAGPERIDQVIPTIIERDAVSHHTLEVQRLLRSLGFQSDVFALNRDEGLAGQVRPLSELSWYPANRQWVCYQASIGSPAAEAVLAHPGVRLLNYHNITPAELVEAWMPTLADEVCLGREQLSAFGPGTTLAVAVSDYNRRELDELGFRRTAVAALMLDRTNFDTPPDPERVRRLGEANAGGGADWLYVGQMLPHKGQYDLVAAFGAFRREYDGLARLHLVGRPACEPYEAAVRQLVDELGLGDSVALTGSISPAELVAYYRSCDVFVGCSEHEGFCAPLLEAMHHGLPVVAYGVAAVPDTVADAGVLLGSKDPSAVATAVAALLEEDGRRDGIVARGHARAASYDAERSRSELTAALEMVVAELPSRRARAAGQVAGAGTITRVNQRRPVRIDQVTPSIVGRDAVSFHYLEAQRVLRSLGFVSEIYCVTMGPEMAGRAHLIEELPREAPDRQWICYQASIGSPAADVVAAHPGVKLVDYHNITPAELVGRWMPSLAEELRLGREQLAMLAPLASLGLGDSRYNVDELDELGYRRTVVSMLMLDRSNFDIASDPRRRAEMAAARSAGGSDWLYVGQMIPHKAQHALVMGFAAYLKAYDPAARLHIVGRDSCASYALGVRELVAALGIGENVVFEGSISAPELAALYASCDVFVGCSDHEGFCAPLLEAMHHGLPLVVYGAAAVPETVADAGIVLPSKEPAVVAAAVHGVLCDDAVRASLVEAGLDRAAYFTPERARDEFRRVIETAVAELAVE